MIRINSNKTKDCYFRTPFSSGVEVSLSRRFTVRFKIVRTFRHNVSLQVGFPFYDIINFIKRHIIIEDFKSY